MSSLRIARAALRARSAAVARPVQRRGYADAVSDKIKLSLALPHNVRLIFGVTDFGTLTYTTSQFTNHRMCKHDLRANASHGN